MKKNNDERIRVIIGVHRDQYLFKQVLLANAGINAIILALVVYFLGINSYSSIYLISVILSVLATIIVLVGVDRSSLVRTIALLPSILLTHNIILIIGSGSHFFGPTFSFFVIFSLTYIISMTFYEVWAITRDLKFMPTARKNLGNKEGFNYYCKPDLGANLLQLSPIKRTSGWILFGIWGVLQKIVMAFLLFLLIASFLFKEVGEGFIVTWFLLSISGIIFSILARPLLVIILSQQLAVFTLEKELNAEKRKQK